MLHSRIHNIKYISKPGVCVYVKRDDELGFGISGTKLRKYESLLKHIKQQSIKHVLLIGGAYSNNIVSLTQLLIEQDIKPYLFLRGDKLPEYKGNFLLISLLIPASQIFWIKRTNWPNVKVLAKKFIQTLPHPCLLVPEGACMIEALPGCLSLAKDISKNEQEHKIIFDHIFIEAGTGLSGIGLILGLRQLSKNCKIHILLLAINKTEFLEKLKKYYTYFAKSLDSKLCWETVSKGIYFYMPTTAKSFGSTNKKIFKTIIDVARQDGILTDPIYTAKLFFEAKHIISSYDIIGNILIMHGGGGLGLMGYQEELQKLIQQEIFTTLQ